MKDALGHGSAAHQNGVSAALKSNQDGTFDRFGRVPSAGFMVGGAAQSRYTGAWTDQKTGQRYVEKSTRVSSEPLARSLGRMRNQIAVWDLGRQREIATGGSGHWTPH